MWWSWVLAAIGVAGLYLTTRRDWRGYLIGAVVQVLWVAYAVTTQQWGFILSAVAYGAVNALGIVRWRRSERELIESLRVHGEQVRRGEATQVQVLTTWTCPLCKREVPIGVVATVKTVRTTDLAGDVVRWRSPRCLRTPELGQHSGPAQ